MKHILTLFSFFLCISLSVLAQSLENDVQKSQTDKDIQAAKDLIKQPLAGYAGLSFTTGNP